MTPNDTKQKQYSYEVKEMKKGRKLLKWYEINFKPIALLRKETGNSSWQQVKND